MQTSLARAALTLGLAFPLPTTAAPDWEWRGPAALLDIDLVRAEVTVVSASKTASVRIVPTGPDAGAAMLDAVPAGGAVRIRDAYPRRGGRWQEECLPPVDARGDYWTYVVPLRVTIAVPPGTQVRIRLMHGDIRAPGMRERLDLQTRDGQVIQAAS